MEEGVVAEVEKSGKITINLGLVDLGQIDLLVDEGFYASRTDFIRTAIRRQLDSRAAAVNDTPVELSAHARHAPRQPPRPRGITGCGAADRLRVLGLADRRRRQSRLAVATIASVEVLGAFRASRAVKAALASRTI